jgi:DsbC/DsbD-like thiol-disulfide interchange protein
MRKTVQFKFTGAIRLLAIAFFCDCGMRAQSFSVAHAKVELLAEQNTLEPGHAAWIGVLFDLEKGWHIYWVNPGESGEAPKFQWQLPAGFHAGEVRWPAPVRIGTGTVIDYGYEGKVLLPLPLAVPTSYKPGAPVALAADVRYLGNVFFTTSYTWSHNIDNSTSTYFSTYVDDNYNLNRWKATPLSPSCLPSSSLCLSEYA